MKELLGKKISLGLPKYFWLFLAIYATFLLIKVNAIFLIVGDESVYYHSVLALQSGFVDTNNHPLLAKTIWYITSSFFGILTSSADPVFFRLGTILFSLISLIALFKISLRFLSSKLAFVVCLLTAADPMYFVFSRLMQLDIINLSFALWSFYFFLEFVKNTKSEKLILAGLFLGFSLAVKLSSLLLCLLYLIYIFFIKLEKLERKVTNLFWFFVSIISGFLIGNSLFFFKQSSVNFFLYTRDLFYSQLMMGVYPSGYMYSQPLSWFFVPQILPLFRLDYGTSIQTIAIIHNPFLFILMLPAFFYCLWLTFVSRKKYKSLILVLGFIVCFSIPWFFNVHATYYYYLLPIIPLANLCVVISADHLKFNPKLIGIYFFLSIFAFFLFYPLAVGLKIPDYYEKVIYKYSLYKYPYKNSLLCQKCSPQ